VKQCTLDSDADHILAASFLRRFIDGDLRGCTSTSRPATTRADWRMSDRHHRVRGKVCVNLLLDQKLAD